MPTYIYQDSAARKPYEEPGDYLVTVENFKFAYATSGNETLKLILRTGEGALIYDQLVFTETSWWKIDHALKCFLPSKGAKPPLKGEPVDMSEDWVTENLLGASGWVTLSKGTTPAGKIRNEVQAYLPPRKGDKGGHSTGTTTTKPSPSATPTSASATTKPPTAPATTQDDDEIPF